jgi:hypothetical protein
LPRTPGWGFAGEVGFEVSSDVRGEGKVWIFIEFYEFHEVWSQFAELFGFIAVL